MPNPARGMTVGAGFKPALGAGYKPAPTVRHGAPEIVRGFKIFSSRRINKSRGTVGTPAWGRNYYEHVIRNDRELNRVRDYIISNPARWVTDKENPNVSVRRLTEHTDE